jgi:hypothetical protein
VSGRAIHCTREHIAHTNLSIDDICALSRARLTGLRTSACDDSQLLWRASHSVCVCIATEQVHAGGKLPHAGSQLHLD